MEERASKYYMGDRNVVRVADVPTEGAPLEASNGSSWTPSISPAYDN